MTIVLDGSSGITAPGGTAAAPSITTTGDVNTGIFFPAADTIAFTEGGTESIRIDSSGNLGIGTTSPTNPLSVVSDTSAQVRIGTVNTNVNARITLAASGTGLNVLGGSGAAPLAFFSASSEQMRLDTSGNLGLGVTPSAWFSGYTAFQIPAGSFSGFQTATLIIQQNSFFSSVTSDNRYVNNGFAGQYAMVSGEHRWLTAASGTAGNAISFTQAMTLDASGNLGIGTATPGAKLDVNGTIYSRTGGIYTDTLISYSGSSVSVNAGSSNFNVVVNTTERARIDSSGNLGINTSSPSTFGKVAIQVTGTTTPTTVANIGPSSINLYAATNGGSTSCTTGIFGWNATTRIASGIGFSRESSVDWGTQIRFYTHPTATSNIGDITERARIDSSGTLMVNTTDEDAGVGGTPSTNQFTFRPADGMRCSVTGANYFNRSNDGAIFNFRRNGTAVGSISVSAGATAYNTSSDYRLKNTIAPITGALAKVALLKPCTFKWNVDGSDGQGFIAHELAEVVPDCVTGEKDGVNAEGNPRYQGVDTSFLVATLTAAIQELTARVAALEGNN